VNLYGYYENCQESAIHTMNILNTKLHSNSKNKLTKKITAEFGKQYDKRDLTITRQLKPTFYNAIKQKSSLKLRIYEMNRSPKLPHS
jgi:hypothetical protein